MSTPSRQRSACVHFLQHRETYFCGLQRGKPQDRAAFEAEEEPRRSGQQIPTTGPPRPVVADQSGALLGLLPQKIQRSIDDSQVVMRVEGLLSDSTLNLCVERYYREKCIEPAPRDFGYHVKACTIRISPQMPGNEYGGSCLGCSNFR